MESNRDTLRFENGSLHLLSPWSCPATGSLLIHGRPVPGEWSGSDSRWRCSDSGWQLEVSEQGAGAVGLQIKNIGHEPASLDTVHFARWTPESFSPKLDTAPFRELILGTVQGANSGVKCVGRKAPFLDFVAPSSMLAVYQEEDGDALLLGVLPPVGEGFAEFCTTHSDPHLEGTFGIEVRHVFNCRVPPGRAVSTSPIVALSGTCGTDLMSDFGRLWLERLERKPDRRPVVGWSSWDHYSGAISRQAMDLSLQAGKERFGDALEVFSIDEGWERQWGTWEPNAKFSEGLEDFCRHVKSQGCTPGVWTAPLLVNTYNPLFLDHPDWFAERPDGQLQTDSYAYGPMAYLDVTKPEVMDFLRGIFTRLRKAGFEYFKIDFCHCILNASRFSDPTVGRNGLIRRAFRTVRDAIGDEAYLLSCGSPYESVAGIVDAVRTTGDIHVYWGHVLRNAGNLAVKWWMQGNLWNCDPDFLVVRGPETADPPYGRRRVISPVGPEGGWLAGREFDETEARTYALLVHLTGGDVVLGDALEKLNPAGQTMLERVLAPRNVPGVPVDLFTSEQDQPRIWISRGEKDVLVGLFNWSEKTTRLRFEPAEHGLKGIPVDFWTGAPTSVPELMPRRSSAALIYPL